MKKRLNLNLKPCIIKAGRYCLTLLLICPLLFSLSTCSGKKPPGKAEEVKLITEEPEPTTLIKPITVERRQEPQILQTANEATTIALRQYIYARLATEDFLTIDSSSVTMEELSKRMDELLLVWEDAELLSSSAEDITNQAVRLLEASNLQQSSAIGQPQNRFMTLDLVPSDFQLMLLATGGAKKFAPQTWAENLTKQYDDLKGAQRYKQLAEQLGTDAKTTYERMALAQKIIQGKAMADAAFWHTMTTIAETTKTASKVGVFITATIASGGGSLSALGASSMTLGKAGAVVVAGTDCIVDIGATGSNIILGDNHRVSIGFNTVKGQLAPVSALVGLVTFNPAETGEQLAYIGDTLVDLFFEGKIMGIKLGGGKTVTTHIFEENAKAGLKEEGFVLQDKEHIKGLSEILSTWKPDVEGMIARLDALISQMAELEQMAGKPKEPDKTLPQVPAVNMNISGTYTLVSIHEKDEPESSTIIIQDNGNGELTWTDSDGDELVLPYDPNTNTIYIDEDGFEFQIEFYLFEGKIIGGGYTSMSLLGSTQKTTLSLSKIAD